MRINSRKDTLEECVRLEVVGSEVYGPASQTLTTYGLGFHSFFKFHYGLESKWWAFAGKSSMQMASNCKNMLVTNAITSRFLLQHLFAITYITASNLLHNYSAISWGLHIFQQEVADQSLGLCDWGLIYELSQFL